MTGTSIIWRAIGSISHHYHRKNPQHIISGNQTLTMATENHVCCQVQTGISSPLPAVTCRLYVLGRKAVRDRFALQGGTGHFNYEKCIVFFLYESWLLEILVKFDSQLNFYLLSLLVYFSSILQFGFQFTSVFYWAV